MRSLLMYLAAFALTAAWAFVMSGNFFPLLTTATAQAQTTISVDINKAKLAWDWTQGSGGTPTEFRVKCGTATGNYTKVTTIADPAARQANVKDVITGSGNWFCAVSAANSFDESGNSNEVHFAAGAAPLAPTNARVTAQ